MLSQSGVVTNTDTLVITAQIKSYESIVSPSKESIVQAMLDAHYVVLLPSAGTPANNGSSTPLLWIVVICGVLCALCISMCIVLYVRSYQHQREASHMQQDRSLHMEANIEHQNLIPTRAAYETQKYMPPYYDPHSE
jgi:hypothetical protein